MATTVYGIQSCDRVRAARAWLTAHGVAHGFHDYRANGIDPKWLKGWVRAVGWETLLNRASTTFKELPAERKSPLDEKRALSLMLAEPTVIKRPVLETDGRVIVGFKPEVYAEVFR